MNSGTWYRRGGLDCRRTEKQEKLRLSYQLDANGQSLSLFDVQPWYKSKISKDEPGQR